MLCSGRGPGDEMALRGRRVWHLVGGLLPSSAVSPFLQHPPSAASPTPAPPLPCTFTAAQDQCCDFPSYARAHEQPGRKNQGLSHCQAADMNIFLGFWCPDHPLLQPGWGSSHPPPLPAVAAGEIRPPHKLLVIPGFSKTQQPRDRFQ